MASLLKEGEAVLADRQHAEVADQALVRLHTRNGPYGRHTNGGRSPMRPGPASWISRAIAGMYLRTRRGHAIGRPLVGEFNIFDRARHKGG